jgi:hypothetical protein
MIIACGADGYEFPASYWAAPADSGDDPDVDDVHRGCLIIDFVEDPDVARVQPVHVCGTLRDRVLWVVRISQ